MLCRVRALIWKAMVIISVMAVSMCGVILSFIRRSWSWSEGFSAPLAALNIAQISEICKTSFNVLTWVLDFLSVATVLMPETLMDLAAIIDYTKEAALLSPVETKLKKLLTVPLLFIYLFLMWNNISWSISNKRESCPQCPYMLTFSPQCLHCQFCSFPFFSMCCIFK